MAGNFSLTTVSTNINVHYECTLILVEKDTFSQETTPRIYWTFKMNYSLLIVFSLLMIASSIRPSRSDKIIPLTKENVNPRRDEPATSGTIQNKNADLISDFFSLEQIELASSLDDAFFNKFDGEVVGKMNKVLLSKDDFELSFKLNMEINSMIYEKIKKSIVKTDEPFTPIDDAILQTLDLIVPNSDCEPLYAKAKKDLRKIYIDQPITGHEILEILGARLQSGEVHTMDAVEFLEAAYHGWIPFYRASIYLATHGS